MASPVLAFSQLATEFEAQGLTTKTGEKLASELAKTFSVQGDEVAILRMEKLNLHFVYPSQLQHIGSIPLNTASSVAARTANTKRAEIINNFAQTKHASVFEAVNVGSKPKMAVTDKATDKHAHVIQKLMSVPVVSPAGVLGVIQVCRKGFSAPAAGADFTPADLQRLVAVATSLVKCFKAPVE
jgi:hypothetical protein